MKNKFSSLHPFSSIFNSTLINLPAPASLSYIWNWGSLLGVTIALQILTGVLLACHYNPNIITAFPSVIHIMRDLNSGWALRFLHINGASFLFILIYVHIARGIFFSGYKRVATWFRGILILTILMATSFLGYVLPWGQISFWGATVITNLLSAIPLAGNFLVQWLWGGFSVSQATLNRFFSLHFVLPFIIMGIIIFHLTSLHLKGSNRPIRNHRNRDKILFHPYFSGKDLLGIIIFLWVLSIVSFLLPFSISDPENFNPADPLITPLHIQPEWYFLFAYAILRSIPNKLGGVVGLLMSIIIIAVYPFKNRFSLTKKFSPSHKIFFWLLSSCFCMLTWLGAMPIEEPYDWIRQFLAVVYFFVISIS